MTTPRQICSNNLTELTPTRADYMDGRVTFAEYYRAVAQTCGLVYPATHPAVVWAQTALAKGDEHLNGKPLSYWDMLAAQVYLGGRGSLHYAFKRHGDGFSLAGGVCVVKQAVIDAVNRANPHTGLAG